MDASDEIAHRPPVKSQWTLKERFHFKNDPILKIFCGKMWVIVKGSFKKKNGYLYNNETLLGPVLRTVADGEITEDGKMHSMCLLLLRPGAFVLYKDVAHLCWESNSKSTITVLRVRDKLIRPDLLANT